MAARAETSLIQLRAFPNAANIGYGGGVDVALLFVFNLPATSNWSDDEEYDESEKDDERHSFNWQELTQPGQYDPNQHTANQLPNHASHSPEHDDSQRVEEVDPTNAWVNVGYESE